jgi:flagellar hook-length control protein FliK
MQGIQNEVGLNEKSENLGQKDENAMPEISFAKHFMNKLAGEETLNTQTDNSVDLLNQTENGEESGKEKTDKESLSGQSGMSSAAMQSQRFPEPKMSDPGMSLAKLFLRGDEGSFNNKEAVMFSKFAQNVTTNVNGKEKSESKAFEMLQTPEKTEIHVDPKTYASLMQKSDGFVAKLKDIIDISSDFPRELMEKFDDLSSELKLNRPEKQLFGKSFEIAFKGANNAQNGLERLIQMLDMGEVSNAAPMFKLYSEKPIKVSSDMQARDNIAKFAMKMNESKGITGRKNGLVNKPVVNLQKSNGEMQEEMINVESSNPRKFNDVTVKHQANVAMPNEAIKLDSEMIVGKSTKSAGQNQNFITQMPTGIKNVESLQSNISEVNQKAGEVNVENLFEQVGSRIGMIAKKDGGEMKIKLHPESMGEIHLKVETVNDDVKIKIMTANKNVKGILESQIPTLKENLSAQNLNLSKVDVNVNLNSGGQNQENSEAAFARQQDQGESRGSWGRENAFSNKGSEFSDKAVKDLSTYRASMKRFGNRHNYVA